MPLTRSPRPEDALAQSPGHQLRSNPGVFVQREDHADPHLASGPPRHSTVCDHPPSQSAQQSLFVHRPVTRPNPTLARETRRELATEKPAPYYSNHNICNASLRISSKLGTPQPVTGSQPVGKKGRAPRSALDPSSPWQVRSPEMSGNQATFGGERRRNREWRESGRGREE